LARIKYIGFDEATGYGISSRALFDSLRKEGAEVKWVGIKPGNVEGGGIHHTIHEDRSFDVIIVHTVPEYYPYWYHKEKSQNPNVRIWAYTAWETSKIPNHWVELLNLMDGILIPSNWNREVFIACGITSAVKVLPHISEFAGNNVAGCQRLWLDGIIADKEKPFLFYTIGVWNERKNTELLMRAFSDEFLPHENAALIVKTGKADWTSYKRDWRRGFRKGLGKAKDAFKKALGEKHSSRIYHLDNDFPAGEIAGLHESCDCFVSLSRGEGWGMGAYEAAWFGKPVVVTAFGGFTDFLPAEFSYHVNYELIKVSTAFGKQSYNADQEWAEADVMHARQLMREIFADQNKARLKGSELGNYIRTGFNSSVIAKQCLKIINA